MGSDAERALVPWDYLSEFVDEEIQRCAELKIELSLLAVQLNTFAVDDEGKQPNQDLAVHHILGVIEKCLHPADELSRDGKVFHAAFAQPKSSCG